MSSDVLFLLGLGANVYGGISQMFSAKAEMDVESTLYREQAASDEAQAEREREATYQEQLRLLRKGRRIKGMQIARAGATGVTAESFLPAMIETAKELELERYNASETGKQREKQFRRRALLNAFRSQSAKAKGRSLRTAGLLSTAGTLGQGLYQYSKMI